MSEKELRSYRLASTAEPSDEMLDAIMNGVAATAQRSTDNAKKELDRRFNSLKKEIKTYRNSLHRHV